MQGHTITLKKKLEMPRLPALNCESIRLRSGKYLALLIG